jgi:hypothetical protein
MSAATVCPKCSRTVSLPAGDDRSVWVHCPLCHSEYPLKAALDYVPPALAIIPAPLNDAMSAIGSTAMGADMFQADGAHAAEQAGIHSPQHPELGPDGFDLGGPDHLAAGGPIEHGGATHGLAGHESGDHELIDPDFADHAFGDTIDMPHAPHEPAGGAPEFADAEFAPHDTELSGSEHDAPEFGAAEHDAAGFGAAEHTAAEFGAEHGHADDAEFQFRDELDHGEGGEHAGDESPVEGHQLGAIASMVQTAPPPRKKRKPRLLVRVIGLGLFFGSGILGLLIVYSVFLLFGMDQFGIGKYWPAFINRAGNKSTANAPNKPLVNKPVAADVAAPGPGGTMPNPNGFPAPADGSANPGTIDKGTANTTGPTAPPATGDLAQNTPPTTIAKRPADKGDGELTRTEDPLSSNPADAPDKTDLTKIDPVGPAPPKIDLPLSPPKLPGGDSPTKTPDKPADTAATKKPDAPTDKPLEKPTDKPADKTPDNTATPAEKPTTDKPGDKPAEPPQEGPAPQPDSGVGLKTPATIKIADVDSAAQSARTARDAYNAAATATDPTAAKKSLIGYYRAMSHLATVLAGRVDDGGPNAAATQGRIDATADELLTGPGAALTPAQRDSFGMLTTKWIASPSRKEAGVLLIGKLLKTQPAGRVFISQVQLYGAETEITVATSKNPTAAGPLKAGDGVIVLGTLVDEPAQHLNGYEGNAAQVVWAVNQLAPVAAKADEPGGAKPAPEQAPK